MKTPLAKSRPRDEERPAWSSNEFDAMSRSSRTNLQIASPVFRAAIDAAGRNGVLDVPPLQDEGYVPPGMIMERSIVVGSQELVEVDIEEAVARNDEPSSKIMIVTLANDEVWTARQSRTQHQAE